MSLQRTESESSLRVIVSLGRGMMTGRYKSRDDLAEDDGRRWFPRYSEEVGIVIFTS